MEKLQNLVIYILYIIILLYLLPLFWSWYHHTCTWLSAIGIWEKIIVLVNPFETTHLEP